MISDPTNKIASTAPLRSDQIPQEKAEARIRRAIPNRCPHEQGHPLPSCGSHRLMVITPVETTLETAPPEIEPNRLEAVTAAM